MRVDGQLRSHRNINYINNIVGQLPGVICSKVVPTTFDKQDLAAVLRLEGLKGTGVGTNIFADRCVRTATSLNGENALLREGLIADQELLIFTRENVVCHCGYCLKGVRKE